MEGNVRRFRIRMRTLIFIALCAAILLFYSSAINVGGPTQQSTMDDKPLAIASPLPILSAHNTSCKPRTNIMFLKTHKCASSTVQNILMRYGNTRNLTFVLPAHGNYLGHPIKFNSSLAIPLPSVYGKMYNIFCHHTRWEQSETIRIMPEDTLYISIIKEPAAMFESLYNWVNLDQRYGVPLEKFILTPAKYYHNSTEKTFARNPMSFDFGLEMEEFNDQKAIKRKLEEIDSRFSLILLADFMDESLVLLRELFCWTWEDVVVFKVNARKSEFKKELSSGLKEKIRKWNSADVQLYDFFAKKFDRQLEKYERTRMARDVKLLRNLSSSWYKFCVRQEISKNETNDLRFQVWHSRVSGFQLTPAGLKIRVCIQMAMAENPFTDYLRMKLWPNFGKVVPVSPVKDSWKFPGFW